MYSYIFVVCRGDFEVQFKHENIVESQFKHDTVSVFQLFYDMTSTMLRRSILLNERTRRVIYHRMLWSKSKMVYTYVCFSKK